MRYLARKFLSFVLPLIIVAICVHGATTGFTDPHYYGIGISAVLIALIWFGKIVRKIIFFPFNLLRKVLFRF